jgi:hypothetical protein
MIGMYMYASGAQRQSISVLSSLGLSESYSNLVSKNVRRVRILNEKEKALGPGEGENVEGTSNSTEKEAPKVPTGTLYQLSEHMRQETQKVAATGLFVTVYDNININFPNPEEIIGRHGE